MKSRLCWICYVEEEISESNDKSEIEDIEIDNMEDKSLTRPRNIINNTDKNIDIDNTIDTDKNKKNNKNIDIDNLKNIDTLKINTNKNINTDTFKNNLKNKKINTEPLKKNKNKITNNQPDWIRPCKCRGSLEYVHRKCFIKFITFSRSGLKCNQCQTNYNIFIKEYFYIKIYEALHSFSLGFLFTVIIGISFISAYLILFIYGASLTFITLGKETIYNLIINNNTYHIANYTGIVRMLIAFPLIPISLLFTKPFIYAFLLNIIIFILIIESTSLFNIFFSSIPIFLFFYRMLMDIIKEYLIPNSYEYFNQRIYLINSYFAEFPFPAKEGIIVLLLPFLSAFVGYFIFGSMSIIFTILGGFLLLVAYDLSTILYIFMVKRRQDTLEVQTDV